MELQQMRYVIAVAETRNFTRAAERCRVVQSALSHQIAKLERELGARLFDRTSRSVTLTAAGTAFLPAARQALEAADRARAEVAATSGVIRGRLAIGAIPTVTAVHLPTLVSAFRDRHPEVMVQVRPGNSDELAERIRQRTLDAGFLGLRASARPVGVRSRVLARGELVAVVPPDHRLAARRRIELADLAAETFVDFPAGTTGRAQSDEAFAAAGIVRTVAFEMGMDYLPDFVRAGLGIALLPAGVARALADLTAIAVRGAPRRVEYLAWGRHAPSPATAAFLELVIERTPRSAPDPDPDPDPKDPPGGSRPS